MKESIVSSQIYTVKCALAGVLAITLAQLLTPYDSISATFVSILCVKPTFYTGLVTGKEQFIASFWGGLITAVLVFVFGKGILVSALALVIIVSLCRYMHWDNYFVVAAFTTIYMLLMPFDNTLEGVVIRMSSVFLGVASASLVNLALSFFRYKSFFDYRIKYASSLIYSKFKDTIKANQNADIPLMEILYNDYEKIYNQLNSFSSELSHIEKELKFRKKAGGLSLGSVYNIYRIIENLKMIVRYLQDISFISQGLAPEHHKIPESWKEKLDYFWDIEEKRYQSVLTVLIDKNTNLTKENYSYDNELLQKITDKIESSESDNNKKLFTEFLAIFTDFQQLHFTITNFDYFSNKYIENYNN